MGPQRHGAVPQLRSLGGKRRDGRAEPPMGFETPSALFQLAGAPRARGVLDRRGLCAWSTSKYNKQIIPQIRDFIVRGNRCDSSMVLRAVVAALSPICMLRVSPGQVSWNALCDHKLIKKLAARPCYRPTRNGRQGVELDDFEVDLSSCPRRGGPNQEPRRVCEQGMCPRLASLSVRG